MAAVDAFKARLDAVFGSLGALGQDPAQSTAAWTVRNAVQASCPGKDIDAYTYSSEEEQEDGPMASELEDDDCGIASRRPCTTQQMQAFEEEADEDEFDRIAVQSSTADEDGQSGTRSSRHEVVVDDEVDACGSILTCTRLTDVTRRMDIARPAPPASSAMDVEPHPQDQEQGKKRARSGRSRGVTWAEEEDPQAQDGRAALCGANPASQCQNAGSRMSSSPEDRGPPSEGRERIRNRSGVRAGTCGGAQQVQCERVGLRRGRGGPRVALDWQRRNFVPDHVRNPHKYTVYTLDEPLVVGGGERRQVPEAGREVHPAILSATAAAAAAQHRDFHPPACAPMQVYAGNAVSAAAEDAPSAPSEACGSVPARVVFQPRSVRPATSGMEPEPAACVPAAAPGARQRPAQSADPHLSFALDEADTVAGTGNPMEGVDGPGSEAAPGAGQGPVFRRAAAEPGSRSKRQLRARQTDAECA